MLALYLAVVCTLSDSVESPPLVSADSGAPVESATPASDPPLVRVPADPPPEPAASIPHVALAFDAGLPDGLGASLALRPWSWLRLTGGIVTNTISPGIRAGVTVIPFHFAITPTLSVEAGHYFDGDANHAIGFVTQQPSFYNAAFAHVGYDFVDGQIGIEIGFPDRWAFSIRAGLGYVHTSPAFQQGLAQVGFQMSSVHGTGVIASTQSWLLVPSVKANLTLYLF